MVYFDAASAEPLHPAARETLLAALADGWADPARLHREGRQARLLLDQAREVVATELGCRADELSFTTSGTQAVHLGLLGAAAARQSAARGPGHLVTSAVEHSSVLNTADWLARRSGMAVSTTGVDRLGRADLDEFVAALQPGRTLLACLQTANNEVATLQPVAEEQRPRARSGRCRCSRTRRPRPDGCRCRAGVVGPGRQRAQVGRPGGRRCARRPQGRPLARAGATATTARPAGYPGSRTCPRFWRPRPR